MKKFEYMILLIFIVIGLSACAESDSDGKTEITFWHMSPVGSEGFREMRAIINTFNESQDDIVVLGTGFSFWDYWDKINIAISSRTAPDLGFHTIDNMVVRAEAGVLHNLSELIMSDLSDQNIALDQFRQSQLDFLTYNSDLYALPLSATTRVLYYNLDMFESMGYDIDDIPTNWDELHEMARVFDIFDDGDIVRLGFDPTYGNATYHGWLWQTGEDFFDEDLNPTLTTQTHEDVLEWIVNFNDIYTRNQLQSFGEANQLLGINVFAAEKVAMIVDSDGLYRVIEDAGATFNYGVAPIPLPDENGIRVNWGSGFSIELYNNQKDEDSKKMASFEFLKYLMSYETQIEFADATGWLTSHIEAMDDYTDDKPILRQILNEVDYAVDKVFVPYAPSWHAADWQTFYTQALDRSLTPLQALEAAKAFYLEKKANYEATRS